MTLLLGRASINRYCNWFLQYLELLKRYITSLISRITLKVFDEFQFQWIFLESATCGEQQKTMRMQKKFFNEFSPLLNIGNWTNSADNSGSCQRIFTNFFSTKIRIHIKNLRLHWIFRDGWEPWCGSVAEWLRCWALQSTGRGFKSWPPHCRVQPRASC